MRFLDHDGKSTAFFESWVVAPEARISCFIFDSFIAVI